MELAIDLQRFFADADLVEGEAERILVHETAQALEDVQHLLDCANRRAGRIEALQTKVASDQEQLIGAQSRRIRSLEDQLLQLQTAGDDQATALDQVLALVAELETRIACLERINAELRAIGQSAPSRHVQTGPTAVEASTGADPDLPRTFGSGDTLTRYNEFVRAHAA